MARCSFCGNAIKPGTGVLFVKRDGTAYYFCSSKCKLNQLKLHRNPLQVGWTATHHKEKEAAKGEKKQVEKKAARKETKPEKKEKRRERRKVRKAKQRKKRAKKSKKRGTRR